MLITSYNQPAMGDVLLVVLGPDQAEQTVRQVGDIVGIYGADETAIGFNFFNVSKLLGPLGGQGAVTLTTTQIETLNQAIATAGLAGQLPLENPARIVIGKVVALEAHPDSDHLHVAQVDLGGHTEQIVCGAPNVALGQTVVAALPGAMMPDGQIIWPGTLRGVDSYGMLASARELGVKNAPKARGILIMPDRLAAGTPFDMAEAAAVVAAEQ